MISSFKLYVVSNNYSHLLTEFSTDKETPHNNLFSTFDEKVDKTENDQITLTFSMVKYVYGNFSHRNTLKEENHLVSLLPIGATIKLIENDAHEYNLIVKSVAPAIKRENVVYTFTCQDEVSYKWSKRNLGYAYSTIERGGVKNIYDITKDILKDCGINGWDVVRSTYSGVQTDNPLDYQRITFEIEGSNPYNAIIEACNAVGANLVVDYRLKRLSFYQKNKRPFSGYRYRPERNMKSLSVTYSGENMATLLHVRGGTNEKEQIVTMIPSLPQPFVDYIVETNKTAEYPVEEWWNSNTINNIAPAWATQTTEEIISTYRKNASTLSQEEIAECDQFDSIVSVVPHFGQFLFDLSFYTEPSKNPPKVVEKALKLQNLINTNMRNNNIMLKLYTDRYYNETWELNKILYDAESLLEIVYSYYSNELNGGKFDELGFNNDIEKYINLIAQESLQMYFEHIYGGVGFIGTDEYTELNKKLEAIKTKRDNALKELEKFEHLTEAEINELKESTNPDDINAVGDYEYYTDVYNTCLTLCGYKDTGEFLFNGNSVKALYPRLIYDLSNIYGSAADKANGSKYWINHFTQLNQLLWSQIYEEYSEFISEAEYENADELNSFALFKQAFIYFEDLKYPSASFSLETLSIGELEPVYVTLPRPGYRIKVYSDMLNLNDVTVNDFQHKKDGNDLVITQISYDLRKPSAAKITVEQVVQYQTILQKLIKSIK